MCYDTMHYRIGLNPIIACNSILVMFSGKSRGYYGVCVGVYGTPIGADYPYENIPCFVSNSL